jgi:energy-coupling factor transporter ATP-binding protein EcfA2
VLFGNVSDQFLLNGDYVLLEDFLQTYLLESGREIVVEYDTVDGLRLLNEVKMRRSFDQIRRGEKVTRFDHGDVMAGDSPAPTPSTTRETRSRVSPFDAATAPGSDSQTPVPRSELINQPNLALETARILLRQVDVASAMVFYHFDRVVSDPKRFPDTEREFMIRLEKTLRETGILESEGPLQWHRNPLIIVAGQLSAVPEWVYRDNPFVALVQINRPTLERRRAYIEQFITGFNGGEDLENEEKESVIDTFSDLTDGMTAWDFEAIRRASILENMPISKPRELVDYFKYGLRDDPWQNFDEDKIRDAESILSQQVIGQEHAVRAVSDMLVSARVGLEFSKPKGKGGKPKGVFFFVGPTGVGKTELAKALTGLIFSDESAFARFDMSEYKLDHSDQKLTGAPPGYVGYDEGGQLTNWVLEKPFSVLLFDEIEKANPRVMDLFLQILEDGRLTDSKGRTAYFSQSVIIFTSNIGSERLSEVQRQGEPITDESPSYLNVKNHFEEAVRHHFNQEIGRPEILNRMSRNILAFDVLRPRHVRGIYFSALSFRNLKQLEILRDQRLQEMSIFTV